MITAVALNPSIDRTLEIDRLCPGGLNRVRRQTDVAAGKGANVALAAAALGERAACVGFMYADGEEMYRARFAEAGVRCEFRRCAGNVRVNQKIFDRERGEITELNGMGTPVTDEDQRGVAELVMRYAGESDFLILTGSLPPGCAADTYAKMCADAKRAGCRVALDADGERLRLGIGARPDLIKPNRYELETLLGRELPAIADVANAARALVDGGIGIVVVSLGADGSLIADADGAWRARGAKVEVQSTVAAGDSMIAGLVAGLSRGMRACEALRLGAGCATARCATPPEKLITAADAHFYAEQIEIERLA